MILGDRISVTSIILMLRAAIARKVNTGEDMSSFFEWIEKYYLTSEKKIWDVIAWGISEYWIRYPALFGGGFMRNIDLDPVLRPDIIILGTVKAYVADVNNACDVNPDDYVKIEAKTRLEKDLFNVIKQEYSALHVRHEISDHMVRDYIDKKWKGKAFFFHIIPEIYGFKLNKTKEPVDQINELKDLLTDYVNNRIARVDSSNEMFITEFNKLLSEPVKSEDGRYVTLGTVLDFCLDFKKNEHISDIVPETTVIDFREESFRYASLRRKLSDIVMYQDTAIRLFVQGLFNGKIKDPKTISGPESSFLFVGPPGVGKTYLAKTAAKLLDRPVKTFQMSEYANDQSFHGLIGFEKTWKNSQEGDLTKYVSKNENAVLIFDELEKAHISTIRLFLSILEGGVLTDLYTGKEVDFTNTITIFTTNAGRKFYEEKRGMSISSLSEATLINALKDEKYNEQGARIPSEILSRLEKGNVIGFDHMNPEKLVPIIAKGMRRGIDIIKQKTGIECQIDETMLPYIFLYHMGEHMDARIASSRSEEFMKECLFQLSERTGEKARRSGHLNTSNIKVRIEVGKEDLADELTVPKRKANIVIVCNQADLNRNLIDKRSDKYKLYHVYAEKPGNEYREYISTQLRDHDIDAILVDPCMRENKTGEEGLEGITHRNTNGMRVINWLLGQKGLPPVYCLELKEGSISFIDHQELRRLGVRDIISFSVASNKEERTRMIEELAYERFLASKLDRMISRGRVLEFDLGQKSETIGTTENVTIKINNLSLVLGMEANASEIFISDEMRDAGGFDSVIGGDNAKEELKRFVKFIGNPELYRRTGQQISKGILLYGPPGTGKTKIARAIACEADCPFIATKGSDFTNGDKRIDDIFALARKYAPSIIFIDEIETIGLPAERNPYLPVLKELLTAMDGFSGNENPVFVIAATNAGDAPSFGQRNIYLDEPLLRRFTKKVYMRLPNREERIEYIRMKQRELEGKEYNLEILGEGDIESIADISVGHSLAELENVIILAIGRAAETGDKVTREMLTNCFEETVYGEERKYAADHIRITALHEAGHAFMGFICDEGKGGHFLPEYATIVARGGYLGLVKQKNDEELAGYSKSDLIKHMRISLAGRAAEMVFAVKDGEGLTTGAANDLAQATYIAEGILSRYGMEEGFLAAIPSEVMMKSALAEKYFDKLNGILKRELNWTVSKIGANREKIEKLADELIRKSRLDTKEMAEILNIEPGNGDYKYE